MMRGGVWIKGWLTDEMDDMKDEQCYICNRCMTVSRRPAMACPNPKCGQNMVGVAQNGGAMTPIEDAVLTLGEDEIKIE